MKNPAITILEALLDGQEVVVLGNICRLETGEDNKYHLCMRLERYETTKPEEGSEYLWVYQDLDLVFFVNYCQTIPEEACLVYNAQTALHRMRQEDVSKRYGNDAIRNLR